MVGLLVFICFIHAYSEHSQAYHIEMSQRYFLTPLKSNETVKFYYENSNDDPCEPLKLMTLNFSVPDRISEKKCFEYIALVENQIREEIWTERCDRLKKDDKKLFESIPVIYGGQPAVIAEFPHMGAMGWKAKDPTVKWIFKCGSTLISEKFLLTAAHCSKLSLRSVSDVVQRQPEIVRLGVTDISDVEIQDGVKRKFTDMKIKRIIVHPKYAPPQKYYDIALIELYKEIKFIKSLHPACLWVQHDFIELGNEVTLTGWGYTEHGHLSEVLQVAKVPVLETSLCDQLLRPYHSRNWHGFQNHQICAGELAGGVDTCQGDSGGPIQIKIPLETHWKIYWILGVTSFGIKCGQTNRPGIYTRVSSFIDWIEDIVWGVPKVAEISSTRISKDALN